ncbi:MAG: endonuclease III domain-containing protein [Nitrospiraceae bacterium]|nr:endonuclease III domain-containing protein [Nitrospiraceae bacterium]
MSRKSGKKLMDIYRRLFAVYGPQHWWPGETPFEVAVGAILTQNTNWGNVEKAISNLRNAHALHSHDLHRMPAGRLAQLIRPAGYFNIKAKRLKNFISLLVSDYDGCMKQMKADTQENLRKKLLDVNGIGPETADSIMLYGLDKPVFVIDAYTKRVLSRHNIMNHDESYDAFQGLFHRQLKRELRLYNEYHALFVRVCKNHCKTKPHCDGCPLEGV